MRSWTAWLPAMLLTVGALVAASVPETRTMPLRLPLTTVPEKLVGLKSVALELPPEELEVNGASDYLLRAYHDGEEEKFGLYVGYYPRQGEGKTIHSPRNCLPGGGWEPISHTVVTMPVVGDGEVPVNRYVIARDGERAVVYYWYQGRGRVAASEYLVKWDLLRDAALRSRTEEALVRLVIPLSDTQNEATADALAVEAIRTVIPLIYQALPA
jgi:EpsI family protein